MADAHAEPMRAPADLTELGMRMTKHSDDDVKRVVGVIVSHTALAGRAWWRVPLVELQQETELSRRRLATALLRAEREQLIRRRRNRGHARLGSAGDEYGLPPIIDTVRRVALEVALEGLWSLRILRAAEEEEEDAEEMGHPVRGPTRKIA